jgi:hypothetical protein
VGSLYYKDFNLFLHYDNNYMLNLILNVKIGIISIGGIIC